MEAAASNNEVVYEFPPFLRVYKDGHQERIHVAEVVPPLVEDPKTGVSSKDVVIVPETGVSARLYLPKINNHDDTQPQLKKKKLPLLIYFHGGAFCIESAFSPFYHNYITSLVAEGNVVAVSVDYRLVPDHNLPVAYDDSWAALQWVASHHHSSGHGPESWLNDHADFDRVFLAGDSAGANICHNMAMRAGVATQPSFELKLLGVVLVHPYFWSLEPIGSEDKDMDIKVLMDKLWPIIYPTSTGYDDPLINPMIDPKQLSNLGCNRILVCVAEKDILRDRGWLYYETLRNKSGWEGVVEIMESEEVNHVFHLFNPSSEKAAEMMKRLVSFLNQDN